MSHSTDRHCDTCLCQGGFLAVVPTDYEIYAVANTERKAKSLALNAAKEWLDNRDVKYKSLKELEEWLGCNVYPLSDFGVGQEG